MKSPVGVLCQNDEVDRFRPSPRYSPISTRPTLAGAWGNSAAEPGKFFVCGNAALRRQLVDEAWYKLRQLRGHFLFARAVFSDKALIMDGRSADPSEPG